MVDFSMGPPPAPGGPRAFGGGAGSAQAFPGGEGGDIDIYKPAPVLDGDEFLKPAQQAASEDLTEINEILAEFEQLGHEFELWSQRLIVIQQEQHDALQGRVGQLEQKFNAQEKKRKVVLNYVDRIKAFTHEFVQDIGNLD